MLHGWLPVPHESVALADAAGDQADGTERMSETACQCQAVGFGVQLHSLRAAVQVRCHQVHGCLHWQRQCPCLTVRADS